MENLKQKLYKIMEETDYMDDDLAADVEEFVELEFTGMFKKQYAGNNKGIREVWFMYLYDEQKDKYLKQFNLI